MDEDDEVVVEDVGENGEDNTTVKDKGKGKVSGGEFATINLEELEESS